MFPKPHRFVKVEKKKKIKKSVLKKTLDKLFSLYIRRGGVCEAFGIECKCGGIMNCAHIITRGNLRLRWDENNALCLCQGHHRYWTTRPLEWANYIRTHHSKKYTYVMTHKNEIKKMKEQDYELMIKAYRQRLEFGI